MRPFLLLAAAALPAAGCAWAPAARAADRINPDAAYVKEFHDRVEQYVRLHRELKKSAPPLPEQAEAEAIAAHQASLAKALREARAGAPRGEIITPRIEPLFRRLLWPELKGPGSATARSTVKDGNPEVESPSKPVPVSVNAPYPKDAPVSTMPPSLLLKLPQLPADVLEYRFVGRDLIIRDAVANIIVDYLTEAMPS